MPKSKRDKKISLTKSKKKGLELKQHLINDIRDCFENYKNIFVFSVQNMRVNLLRSLKKEVWMDSRFFFGKNKIMALAFGKSAELEISEGAHKLASAIKGQCGLLFTNKSRKEVINWMEQYEEQEFARSGFVTQETIVLPEGPLEDFSHSIEPHLRQLGMPTSLQKGVITLLKEFEVCRKGQTLTPEQARILKLLGRALAAFKFTPIGVYSRKRGYQKLISDDEEDEDVENEMEVEDEEKT